MDIKLLILLACLGNFYLGVLVFKRGWKTKANLSFSLFAWSLALWTLSFYFYEHPILYSGLIGIKMVYLGAFLIVGSLFYFSFCFPVKSTKSPFLPMIIFTLLNLPLVWLLFFTNLWVKEVVIKEWGIATILGPAYIFPMVIWSLFTFIVFFNWFKAYRRIGGIEKMQLGYVFLGTFLYIVPTIIVDAVIPIITGESRYFWLSPISSLFLVGLVAYAILRYRLMDIRLILRTGIVNFLSILAMISAVLGAIYSFAWFSNYTPNFKVAIIGTVSIFIILLIFNPLKEFILRMTNKYLFKEVYTIQEALKNLREKSITIINLDGLIKEIVDTIKKAFGLRDISFILKEGEKFAIKQNIGFKKGDIADFIKEKYLLEFLEVKKKPLVAEEIERGGAAGNLREKVEQADVSLIVPLFSKGELICFIMLGQKIANEAYTKEDLELLETLGSQAAIAIENAKLYHQIEDLSQNLQKRVDEQTKELKSANAELLQLDKAKSEFISIASHQLLTPLTPIRGYSSMLLEGEYGKINAKQEKAIKMINESSVRLVNLVSDLLDISRIERGAIEYHFSPTDLEELIKSVIEELTPRAKSKNLYLQFAYNSNEKIPKVNADQDKLREVLLNLIDNSIKYSLAGKITINLKKEDNNNVVFSISDNGIGLSKSDMPILFKKFSRSEDVKTIHVGGSGLGLYVAKKHIEAHHGHIWAESPGKGKGSTFFVSLPAGKKRG